MMVVDNLVAQVQSTKLNIKLGYKLFWEANFLIRVYLYVNSGMEPYLFWSPSTRLFWLSFHSQLHGSYFSYSLAQHMNSSQLQKSTNHTAF